VLTFTVPGKPIGTNNAYRRRGRVPGLYMTEDARAFKDRLRAYAIKAVHDAGWRKPGAKQYVAVAIIVWNAPRFDVDSPTKFIVDSMQGVVYDNDRCVDSVTIARSFDDQDVRVEIAVSLSERAASTDRSRRSSGASASAVTRPRPEAGAARS